MTAETVTAGSAFTFDSPTAITATTIGYDFDNPDQITLVEGGYYEVTFIVAGIPTETPTVGLSINGNASQGFAATYSSSVAGAETVGQTVITAVPANAVLRLINAGGTSIVMSAGTATKPNVSIIIERLANAGGPGI
jgi:hypothetical protein